MAGIGSRRQLADAIKKGLVTVNGQVAEDFRHPINTEKDGILMNGKLVDLNFEKAMYLMVNKPKGMLSTTSDERGRNTVIDILPENCRHLRLYPVGRLDNDSTGLLLLTNDGELTYQLTHPKFEYEKEYLVQINGSLKPDEIIKLERGLMLEDGMTHNATVKEVKSTPPFNYSITIHEGKKHQIRRMFISLGHRVLALKRIRIGNLSLGELKEGKTRQLSAQEVSTLLRNKSNTPRKHPLKKAGHHQ